MIQDETRTYMGTVKIHKKVISTIATIAALEVEGVSSLARDFKSLLAEFIGQKDVTAIKIDIDQNDEVKIEVPIIVRYGYNIPETATKVQENIGTALDKMMNLAIKEINVKVKGIDTFKKGEQ